MPTDIWNRKPEQFDVVGTPVDSPREVFERVFAVLDGRWPGEIDRDLIERGFADVTAAFFGKYPGLLPCDMTYHDLRHTIEAALVMARLLDGYMRQREEGSDAAPALSADEAMLGVFLALFHDIGLLRRSDEAHLAGPQLIPIHEERGVEFSRNYLAGTRLAGLAGISEIILITKFGRPGQPVFVPDPGLERVLAEALGTADLLSQMSDRCYLEKCRDFLFSEFVQAGMDRVRSDVGEVTVIYPDSTELLRRTPGFVRDFVARRLEAELGSAHVWLAAHFDGANPYILAVERNIEFLIKILDTNDIEALRRRPPVLAPGRC